MEILAMPMRDLLGPMSVASFLLLWFVVSVLAGVAVAIIRDLLAHRKDTHR